MLSEVALAASRVRIMLVAELITAVNELSIAGSVVNSLTIIDITS